MQMLMLARSDASKFRQVFAKNGDILHFKEIYFHAVKTVEESVLLASFIPTAKEFRRHIKNPASTTEKIYLKCLG
jgi:hypothetical protein